LKNSFTYVLAEGSGDIYKSPNSAQTDNRIISMGTVNPLNASSARLFALYTYGDINQNDRLYFNNVQYGGDDVSNYDKTLNGLDYGPSLVSFDVLNNLSQSNSVKISVSASDVPDTRETSLRPQFVALGVARPMETALPALGISLNTVITWPVSADTFQLEYRENADQGAWITVTNSPIILNGMNTMILPPTGRQQFFQLRKTN
jgi:hypothetical protein